MKTITRVYTDENDKPTERISEVTNIVESIDDLYEVFKDLIKRFEDGWKEFKLEKYNKIEGSRFENGIILHFKKDDEWKYISLRME